MAIKYIGKLWRPKSDKQKEVGIVYTGVIEGLGNVTLWKNNKREGKDDPDLNVTVNPEEKPKPKGKYVKGKKAQEEVEDDDTPY